MRKRRNTLWAIFAAILLVAAILAALLLRKRAAPEVARLLPDADAVVYVNLEPVRLITSLGKNPPKDREPEYQDFVEQTGFEFERDLQKAAFAVHYDKRPNIKTPDTRYSEVFQGHFDSTKLAQYLRKYAKDIERYRDFDIYNIPHDGRTVRVVLLTFDLAAASNTGDPSIIHGIIDRQKQAALPFSGPPLVSDYYRRVPFGSVLWIIARTPEQSSTANQSEMLLPGGWSGLLPRNSTVVASARPLAQVHLRADVITGSELEAQAFTQRMSAFLAVFQSLNISMDGGGPDPDVKAAVQSLEVRQDKQDAILTASIPFGFFKKLLSEPPVDFGGATPAQPATAPEKPSAPTKKK